MTNPKVTVIVPVYNGEKYIGETIQSVLDQTFKDFELVVIDDCSTDSTVKVIETFADSRIKLVKNQKNSGSTQSRNNGLMQSTGEYVAILDSDDVCFPNRFEEQVKFLDEHPDFGAVGSWTKVIDSESRETGFSWKNDLPPEKIPAMMLFKTYITHSSAMIRRSAMPSYHYDTNPVTAGKVEDYTLWIEIMKKWKVANLQQYLVKHRQHKKSLTATTARTISTAAVEEAYRRQLNGLGIEPTKEDLDIHRLRSNRDGAQIPDNVTKKKAWLEKLWRANESTHIYEEPHFSEILGGRWFEFCTLSTNIGLPMISIWRSSPLSKRAKIKPMKKLKFLIKCLIKR